MRGRGALGNRWDVDAIADAWGASGAELEPVSRRAIVAVLSHELTRPAGPHAGWTDTLYEFDPGLAVSVDDCRKLRTVLQRAIRDELNADEVVNAHDRIGLAVDDLLAAAAARRVAALEQTALLDPLTGLGNRRAATADLEAALAHARRHGRHVSVAVADLDGLKQTNDRLGHAAGDEALRTFAAVLSDNIRAGDGAFRFGGDEFVVVAPDTSAPDLQRVFERVRIDAPAFSVGIAQAPLDGDDAARLLAIADERLYANRRSQRAATTHVVDAFEAGLIGFACAAVAACLAEAIRSVAAIEVTGGMDIAWRLMLLGAPLVATAASVATSNGTARRAWIRAATFAAVTLLVLVAALTPLLGRNDASGDRTTPSQGQPERSR